MRIVIIGAGIVGCALADEITRRGRHEVTVLDKGTLGDTGGSSFHAPGLVFQTNPSRTLSAFARYTVAKYTELGCFDPVGSLEVATTEARLAELHRRHGFATSWGIPSSVIGPGEARRRYPLLSGDVLGALAVPGDGLADAGLACRRQAELATSRGARFLGDQRVLAVEHSGGRVTGVRTADATHLADVVVSCAGFWGPVVGALAGVGIPLLPLAHQYARTTALPGVAPPAPILRHQDRDLYFRAHGDRLGIGSYLHDPIPVDPALVDDSVLAFTPDTFAESWDAARALLPALDGSGIAAGLNGVFSFTADGFPLLGESHELRGFWCAEAVWVTHSAGAARAVAEWLTEGRPRTDIHECDLNRFSEPQLSPAYVRERSLRSFAEVYDILHPLDPPSVRGLRTSPFFERQQALGAVFGDGAGWERPLWYEANAALPRTDVPRDEWSSRHWSPIAAAEARATREAVALYDMTPLTRLEVTGPVAYLQRMTSNDVDKPVGSVVYTLLLDHAGGILGDITVARLAEDRFQLGVNGPRDTSRLIRYAPPGVSVRDVTGGTCGLGVWGPRARDLLTPLTDDLDLSHRGFGYFRVRRGHLGAVPVTMLRVSYVGELGWEVYTSAEQGRKLWDTLWAAGATLGLVAAGRAAFTSLRLEKGYRSWGDDVTAEDDPYAAGLGFAVRLDKGDFVGRSALVDRPPPARRLCCLVVGTPGHVPMGREPVYDTGGAAVGFVTSAAYGHTVGAAIAYAWLPASLAVPGTGVRIGYFDRMLDATVAAEPLVDPKQERLRR